MNAPLSNNALIERDQSHMIHPLHQNAAHANAKVWVKSEGSHLIDADGNRFIDGLSCLWNVSLGHGQQSLIDAATKQMQDMAFCSNYNGSSNPTAIELAERLAGICYSNINNFYFTSGGGEATDSNFKVARFYWKAMGKPEKTKVISRQWGYHGVTLPRCVRPALRPTGLLSNPAFQALAIFQRPIHSIIRNPKMAPRSVSPRPMNWKRKS